MPNQTLGPVLPGAAWPLHGRDASRRIEHAALTNAQPHALMRLAGAAVARLALAVAPHARSVWIAAGPGNNGGDGLEAATLLLRAGRRVTVTLMGGNAAQPGDARDALARAQAMGVAISDAPCEPDTDTLAIDALLGVGASRPPGGRLSEAIRCLNAHRGAVLSVDLPSGLHPDTGQPIGSSAVRARHTLSLLTLKPGLFTGSGRDHAGRVWLDTLGVMPSIGPDATLCGPEPLRRLLRPREHASHKGSFGDVLVIGGAAGMVGAAVLAGRAALALGAGRAYLALLDDARHGIDAGQPELMLRPVDWATEPATLSRATVVCGCGGGSAINPVLPPVLHHAARLVLDADALNAVAADDSLLALVRARAARGQPTVATPHPLEAARLLDAKPADIQADRVASALALAEHLQACVVLKGSGSIVAAPRATPSINPTGNALLATAGTGDVLAGSIGALWGLQEDMATPDLAAAATWLHGAAADDALAAQAAAPLTATRLIEAMRVVAGTVAHSGEAALERPDYLSAFRAA
jgi:hydroxyethylthiazole kinase-like uncharacterized protein yjeF